MRAFLRYGLTDSGDMAAKLGIGLYQLIELVEQIKRLVPGLETPSRPIRSLALGWCARRDGQDALEYALQSAMKSHARTYGPPQVLGTLTCCTSDGE